MKTQTKFGLQNMTALLASGRTIAQSGVTLNGIVDQHIRYNRGTVGSYAELPGRGNQTGIAAGLRYLS